MVSSDAIALNHGQFALITYWEARSDSDLDVYRCVDITDEIFATARQTCWRALRPTGRAPRVADRVSSSKDLCGQPNSESTLGSIAFCSFSDPFVVRTPHFELMLTPFESGGLVAAKENGAYLLVTDDEFPTSAFFEVRAGSQSRFSEITGSVTPQGLLQQPPEGQQCRMNEVLSRQWVECQSTAPPLSAVRYVLEDDVVYTVAFALDVSAADSAAVALMFDSLRPGSPE